MSRKNQSIHRPTRPARPQLSVVVLCYKSGELARTFSQRLIKSLEKLQISFEVILVGNYNSTSDPTPAIVQDIAAKDRRVVAVVKRKKGMMGWDLRSGLDKARGQYVAYIDGDNQFKPEVISNVYRQMAKGLYDLVKTRRSVRDDGLTRRIISFSFNLFFDILYGPSTFTDVNSKPKIMTRLLLRQMDLYDSGWFIDAELMIQAKQYGAVVGELPVHFHKNRYRSSFVGRSAIIEVLSKLFLYRFGLLKQGRYATADWRHWLSGAKTTPALGR